MNGADFVISTSRVTAERGRAFPGKMEYMLSRGVRFALTVSLSALIGAAQEHQHHEETASISALGKVSFPISCSASDQEQFNRGMALLHSFGYKDARSQFQQISEQDSACPMAYWGQAMSLYRQLWVRPSDAELAEGAKLIAHAKATPIPTDRERAYIDAAAAFYQPQPGTSFDIRRNAYSDAMKRVHSQWPQDDEATLFYALSLLTSPNASKNDFEITRRAIVLISGVFARNPNHPGAAHYLIHACDHPTLAAEGLDAAKRYAQIAPASPHAVHMPSHIFARLGMWDEDIQSNLASVAVARQQNDGHDMLHAMNFLEYAYLQKGEFEKAKEMVSQALAVSRDQLTDMPGLFNQVRVRFPSLYLLETRDWKAAEAMAVPADVEPDFQAVVYWTRAVGAGHLRDAETARAAVASYDAKLKEVQKSSYSYVAESMASERNEARAWLAFAEGRTDAAVQLITPVADKQDREGKGEVALPAREMLADILLESGRPAEALAQYRLCLRTDPNRLNSLQGAKRAEGLAGQ